MRGIQLRSVGNTNDHIIFRTRSTSTAVETISVYSEEWITPHLLRWSSNRVLAEFDNVESIGSGYALQTLDSTSSLQDFSKICIFFINLETFIIFRVPCTKCLRRCQTPVGLHLVYYIEKKSA